MVNKGVIRRSTEMTVGLARLVFMAVISVLLLAVLLVCGSLFLYVLARVAETVFDLVKGIFGG